MLVSVKLGHIDVDKAHIGVLELRLAGGGKVAVAGADTDNQVGFLGDNVGRQRPRRTDRAQRQRVVIAHTALAGHRLAHGDAGLLHKLAQRLAGFTV